MAYGPPGLCQSLVTLGGDESSADGSKASEGNLRDGDTGTEASGEMRASQGKGYKSTHNVGVDPATLASLSIRVYWSSQMSSGDAWMYPYSSNDATVVTGNEIGPVTISGTGQWFEFVADAAFIADLGEIGTNQMSVRIMGDDSEDALRGRCSEIEIDYAVGGGGVGIPIAAYHHTQHNLIG